MNGSSGESARTGERRVSVVVPVYERREELVKLLESLRRLERAAVTFEVIVVDDCSPVPLEAGFERRYADLGLRLLVNDRNRGPAWGRNRAASESDGDFLWFLDSDTEILFSHTLQRMLEIADDPRVGIVGGIIEPTKGEMKLLEQDMLPNLTFLCRGFALDEDHPAIVAGVTSANIFVRREVFERVDGFSLDLPCYEDNDLCLSVRRQGFAIRQERDTAVLNKVEDAGRETGVFAHVFSDPRRYWKDMLETRIVLLSRHARWKLPALPLLDLVFVPYAYVRYRLGCYVTNRYDKGVPRLTPGLLGYCLYKFVESYARGWGRFFAGPRNRRGLGTVVATVSREPDARKTREESAPAAATTK